MVNDTKIQSMVPHALKLAKINAKRFVFEALIPNTLVI